MFPRSSLWFAVVPLVFGVSNTALSDPGTADIPISVSPVQAETSAQNETGAIVAPVKRVAPKTPSFEHLSATPASKQRAARAVKVVPDTPDCDAGFKVDGTGMRCISTGSIKTGKRRGKQ